MLYPAKLGTDEDFKVSVGLGVTSIPFDFKMRFSYANGGDLRYLKGQIQFYRQTITPYSK